jgi:hypothetical protein
MPGGHYLSLGLYNYGGRFGGLTIRSAPTLVVNARDSTLTPVVLPAH